MNRILRSKRTWAVVGVVVVLGVCVKLRSDAEKKWEMIELAERLLGDKKEVTFAFGVLGTTNLSVINEESWTFSVADVNYTAPDKRTVHGVAVINLARTMIINGYKTSSGSLTLEKHIEVELEEVCGKWVIPNIYEKPYGQRGWYQQLRDRITNYLTSFLP